MALIDQYLPEYNYHEIHQVQVNGRCEDVYHTAMHLDLSQSKIIKYLFLLRGLPFSQSRLSEITRDMKFTLMEENHFTEFIYGFWVKSEVEWVDDKNEFIHGGSAYRGKAVWNFRFVKTGENSCKVITETRVKCQTKKAKFFFSIYWFFVKPFSGLIRKKMLQLIQKNASPVATKG